MTWNRRALLSLLVLAWSTSFVAHALAARGTYTATQGDASSWSTLGVTVGDVVDFTVADHQGWKKSGRSFQALAIPGTRVPVSISITGQPGRSYFDYTYEVMVQGSGITLLAEKGTIAKEGGTRTFSCVWTCTDGAPRLSVQVKIMGGNPDFFSQFVHGIVGVDARATTFVHTAVSPPPPPPPSVPTSSRSAARFSGLTGQVMIHRAGAPPDAWFVAKLDTVLNIEDHVRTEEDSSCILSFADRTTFVMKGESEVVLVEPEPRSSKLGMVAGNIWTNIQRMVRDGSMEIDMNQAVTGIKGTTLVLSTSAHASTVKVVDGAVWMRAKATGATVELRTGQTATANAGGLGPVTTFDVAAESARWNRSGAPRPEHWLIHTTTDAAVMNQPAAPTTFEVAVPTALTMILTYHWNAGRGAPAGVVGLQHEDGTRYGPWRAVCVNGVYWVVNLQEPGRLSMELGVASPRRDCPVLKPGHYTVVDSSPETWAQNAETGARGVTLAKGVPLTGTR